MSGFAQPWLLAWAALATLLALAAASGWVRRRRRATVRLGDASLIPLIAPDLPAPRGRPFLWVAVATLLGVAAAGPLVGTIPPAEGATLPDVVLVLDASNSMRVEDVPPNRLEVQRALARDLVNRLGGGRLALVVFAGQGYVVAPLTRDAAALDAYVEAMAPEMVPQGGSSLSNALRQGGALLAGSGAAGALVLITDGDALEERAEVERVAGLLARARITVHAVGVATRGGGVVPDIDPGTGRRRGVKREPDGRPAHSALGEDLLRDLAARTGGSYRAPGPAAGAQLAATLRTAPAARPAWDERRPGNRWAWLVGAALLLLALDLLLDRRRPRAGALPVVALAALAGCTPTPQADYRAGRHQEAAEGFRSQVERGDTTAVTMYNLATARLRLGENAAARAALEEAARRASAPGVRFAAEFNAGLADLEPAVAAQGVDSATAAGLRRAVERYRAALRLRPHDVDAKWNLELAERRLREPPPTPAGGTGGGGDAADAGDAGPAGPELSAEEVERILAAAEAEERAVQRRRMRTAPSAGKAERDW